LSDILDMIVYLVYEVSIDNYILGIAIVEFEFAYMYVL